MCGLVSSYTGDHLGYGNECQRERWIKRGRERESVLLRTLILAYVYMIVHAYGCVYALGDQVEWNERERERVIMCGLHLERVLVV